jgi:hypothetical protein
MYMKELQAKGATFRSARVYGVSAVVNSCQPERPAWRKSSIEIITVDHFADAQHE